MYTSPKLGYGLRMLLQTRWSLSMEVYTTQKTLRDLHASTKSFPHHTPSIACGSSFLDERASERLWQMLHCCHRSGCRARAQMCSSSSSPSTIPCKTRCMRLLLRDSPTEQLHVSNSRCLWCSHEERWSGAACSRHFILQWMVLCVADDM